MYAKYLNFISNDYAHAYLIFPSNLPFGRGSTFKRRPRDVIKQNIEGEVKFTTNEKKKNYCGSRRKNDLSGVMLTITRATRERDT